MPGRPGGGARPAAPLPQRVRRRPGNFRREPLPRPAWLGGGRCQMPAGREGGGKAGKRQSQPLRPLPDGHLSHGRGAGGRRRAVAAHGGDRIGSPAASAPLSPLTPPSAGLPPRLRPPASLRAGRGGGPGRRAVRGSARPCLRGRRRRAERPCAQRGALSATMRRLPLPCLLLLLLPAEVRPSCGSRGAAAPAPAAAAPARRGRCAAGLGLCPAAAPPAEGRAREAGGPRCGPAGASLTWGGIPAASPCPPGHSGGCAGV